MHSPMNSILPAPEACSRITVASSFTSAPLKNPICYWLDAMQLPASIEFAPYGQVFQQLLDPASMVRTNRLGLNVVLLRVEDLRPFRENEKRSEPCRPETEREIERNLQTLLGMLRSASDAGCAPFLFCLTAPAPSTSVAFFSRMEELARAEFAGLSRVHQLTANALSAVYPIEVCYDPQTDDLGHIPYTPQYFAALGTAISRRFHALTRPPYKVIALDCDHTLWSGVCAEDGADGIKLDLPHRKLQEFMCCQNDSGMLLAVCSKNAREDVAEVFERRKDMPLTRDRIAAWRVNWEPKSENLKSLAAELQVGLDTFIFIDDNPMECAEVRAHCPGALVLQLPSDVARIPAWLDHVWAFDHLKVTAEDRSRAEMYRQNRRRAEFQATFQNLGDFLAGLELKIEISPADQAQLPRIAQLTARTNQFNCTTRRRTENEIERLAADAGACVLAVRASDRFGDYGLVGAVIYDLRDEVLWVDTFLLSCRVLGKGIEYRMLAHLGEIAVARGLKFVQVPFLSTPKNRPARNFLEAVGTEFREDVPGGFEFQFPAEAAAAVRFDSEVGAAPAASEEHESSAAQSPAELSGRGCERAGELALMATDIQQVLQAIESSLGWRRRSARTFQAPRTDLERQIASIWQRLLRVERVGIQDDYFELGGESLIAVQMFARLHKLTGKLLPLATLFEAPTIERLAAVISQEGWQPPWQALVPIKPGGSRPPFYCVHGVGGNILEYLDLATYMDEDQPFYGIQALGLDGKQPNITVEAMAARYIEEVTTFQPRGPYYLGGSSFGGLVAYEMARQLRARGISVAFLALFDTNGPGYPTLQSSTTRWQRHINRLRQRASLHWSNFLACNPAQRRQYVMEKARRWRNQRIEGTIERGKKLRQLLERKFDELFWSKAIRDVNRAGHWAAGDYIAGEYDGRVTLFRATEQPRGIVPDRTLGWGPLAKGGLEIIDTPGHHGAIVRNPRARVLAAQLAASLRQAQSAHGELAVEESAGA